MRAFVTTRGRGGVSFGLFGTIVLGFLYLIGALIVGCVCVIVALVGLCISFYKHHHARKLPPPRPMPTRPLPVAPRAPTHEEIPLQSSKMAEGDVVTLTDSKGRSHHGVLTNRHRKADGTIGYDLIEDPGHLVKR